MRETKSMGKYIYYFGGLGRHYELYRSWVEAVETMLPIEMVTTVSLSEFVMKKEKIEYLRSEGVKVFVIPRTAEKFVMSFVFVVMAVFKSRLVVHVKKKKINPIRLARYLFPSKVRIIVDMEGDVAAQNDYLAKKTIDKGRLISLSEQTVELNKVQKRNIVEADGVKIVTNELLNLVADRHKLTSSDISKFCVLPTGFSSKRFFFNASLRGKYRKQLGIDDKYVITFVGDVQYEWQNIKYVIKMYSYLTRSEIKYTPYLMLIVSDKSRGVAESFLSKYSIAPGSFLLKSVDHKEINGYLNASDLGVLLRDDHMMNKVASPGKLGEYLGAGLQVMTTPYIGTYSSKMIENGIGCIVEEFRDAERLAKKVYCPIDNKRRRKISAWAHDNFSSEANANNYAAFLQRA